MAKPSGKKQDLNTTAFSIVQQVTGGGLNPNHEKNPAAVALGRLGGLKGGKARAASLSKKARSDIARNAAKSRWSKKNP
jgi:hypothetical protein